MFVKDQKVVFTYVLDKLTDTPASPDIDVRITNPENKSTYWNEGVSASGIPLEDYKYIPPTHDKKGMLTFSKAFQRAGLWKIDIGRGNPNSFQIFKNEVFFVVEHDNSFESTMDVGQ